MATLDAALQHDELLTQQRVLGEERARAAGQVGQRAHDAACSRWGGGRPQMTMDGVPDAVAAATDTLEEGSTHEVAP